MHAMFTHRIEADELQELWLVIYYDGTEAARTQLGTRRRREAARLAAPIVLRYAALAAELHEREHQIQQAKAQNIGHMFGLLEKALP